MIYNPLPDDAVEWAKLRNGPRLRVSPAEYTIRVKGVRSIRQSVPGEVGFIAGNGRFGFNGRRFRSRNSSSIITTFPDGKNGQPFNKRGRKVGKIMISNVRQPIKGRKLSGSPLMAISPQEVVGRDPIVEMEKNNIRKLSRKGKRRRTQKRSRKAYNRMMLDEGMKRLLETYRSLVR